MDKYFEIEQQNFPLLSHLSQDSVSKRKATNIFISHQVDQKLENTKERIIK